MMNFTTTSSADRALVGGAIGVADGARAAHSAFSAPDKTRHISASFLALVASGISAS
jgi:hypothetical protein